MRLSPLRLLLFFLLLTLAVVFLGGPPSGEVAKEAVAAEAAQEAVGGAQELFSSAGDIASRDGVRRALDEAGATVEPSGPFGWRGVVRTSDGAPLGGAIVYSESFELGLGAEPLRQTRSDSGGVFVLEWPPETEWYEERGVVALADLDGFYCPQLFLPLPASPPTEIDLVLEEAGSGLRVHLHDAASEAPVPNVPLTLTGSDWRTRAVTDATGSALLRGPAGISCELETGQDFRGGLEAPWPIYLRAGEVLELRCPVNLPPDHLRLIARDLATGDALPDAEYHWVERGVSKAGLLPSQDGVLDWRQPVGGSVDFECQVRAPEHVSVKVRITEQPPADSVWVDLPAGGQTPIVMQFLRSGEPVEGLQILVVSFGPALCHGLNGMQMKWQLESEWAYRIAPRGTTDAEGRVSVEVPGPGLRPPAHLQFRTWSEADRGWTLGTVATEALGPMPWVFDLEADYATVVFQAADADGVGVERVLFGLQIEALPSSPPLLRGAEDLSGDVDKGVEAYWLETGADGVVEWKVAAPSRLRWRLDADDPSWQEDPEPLAGGERRVISITVAGGELVGRVVLADGRPWYGWELELYLTKEDGSPVDGASGPGWLRAPDWAIERPDNEGGTFHFRRVPPGRYRLQTNDFPFVEGSFIRVEPGQMDLELQLAPLCSLRVELVGEDGRPLAGGSGLNLVRPGELWTWYQCDAVDGTGVLQFGAIEESWLFVEPWVNGYSSQLIPLGRWHAGESRELIVRLEPGRHIQLEFESSPLAARVTRVLPAGVKERDAQSVQMSAYVWDGRCGISGATVEGFTLLAYDAEGEPVGSPLEVPSGAEDLELNWVLQE